MSRFAFRRLAIVVVCLAAVACAAASAVAVAQEERAELELRLRRADRKLQQGDTVGALLDVEAVLSHDDGLWEAYWLRGQIQARMGDDLGARDSFFRAAELDPGNAELHFLVASLALQLTDFEAAWRQLAAAAQAGHPGDQVASLAGELSELAADSTGLDEALAAPRLTVTLEGTASGSLRELVLELRTLLLEEPAIGLVKDRGLAAWELILEPAQGADRDAGDDPVHVILRRLPDGEEALEWRLPGTGAEARVRLAELVAEVVQRLGGEGSGDA